MTQTTFRSLFLIGTMIGVAAPVYAQQTPDPAKTATAPSETPAPAAAQAPSATAAPAATPAPATTAASSAAKTSTAAADAPSADLLKKARNAGLHTKVKQGVVYYCKTETEMGSHFSSERCYDENQLSQLLISQQAARDQFVGHSCAGSACSGK